MTGVQSPHDLVVLVADKNMEFAVKGILGRTQALGIQELMPVVHVHPEKDPGCLLRGHEFLSLFRNQYAHALIMLDFEGSGQEETGRESLELEIEKRLSQSGWGDRAAAIVIGPELEMWVWSDSPQVDAVLGWQGKNPDLRSWLKAKGLLQEGEAKPERPKEAMELALRAARKPRSSALYLQLARQVSMARCVDPAFLKLKTILQAWFPL
ncbi:hypothetical protein ACHHRT_03225 [Desulfurivibrio sp. D14AmB]|uniref:methylation-associated defense system protein MAD4 n=1 Tax=Desulfurivibrio sp. D14AmB TaxID=3374370 RepID=UPI00376EF851